jgi:hypothetical protein
MDHKRTFLIALSCGTALGHAPDARPQAGGAPVNDACSGAIEIPCDGTPFIADNTFATTLPSDPRFECDVLPVFGAGTIWYRFTATQSAVRILSTPMGDLTDGGDLALLQGGCDGFTSLRCTRPLTGLSTRLVSSELEPGQEYYIELASSLLGPTQGERLLTVECLNIDPPSNDDRTNAIPFDFCEPQAFATTGATSKSSLYNTVWYVVVGTQFGSMQCQAFSVDIENLSFTVTAGVGTSPIAFSTTFFGRAYADWTSYEGVPYFIEIGSTMPDEGIGALIVSEGGGISGVCDFGGSNTCTTIGFETQDDGVTPLVNGQEIGSDLNGFFAITTSGANAGAVTYSSDPGGDNTSSSDGDLLVDTGNLLILQNNNNATVLQQSVPGIFDTPNDDPEGGAIRFEFMVPAAPMSLQLVDVDNDGSSNQVVLTDVAGRQRTYTVPDEWTGDRSEGEPGMGTLDLTTLNSQPGFGSIATSSQDTAFDDQAVTCIEVRLAGVLPAHRRSAGFKRLLSVRKPTWSAETLSTPGGLRRSRQACRFLSLQAR